jgi:hypothetical protein
MDIEPEYTWLLHRVMRLRTILRYVKDPKAEAGLRELIADAQKTLEQLKARQGVTGLNGRGFLVSSLQFSAAVT